MSSGVAGSAAQVEAADRAAQAQARTQERRRLEAQGQLVGPVGRTLLGVLLVVLGAATLHLVIALWPAVQQAARAGDGTKTVTWFTLEWRPSPDAALLALVVLSSALGSYVHAAVSFTDYVGARLLAQSWIWWYVLRVFVGSALALLFYFTVRGGFLGADQTSTVNPYGIAAISGLVGLFSKQATDKLREVFDTAFRVEKGGDRARGDSLADFAPAAPTGKGEEETQ